MKTFDHVSLLDWTAEPASAFPGNLNKYQTLMWPVGMKDDAAATKVHNRWVELVSKPRGGVDFSGSSAGAGTRTKQQHKSSAV